jgi:hypothetical protein
MKVVCEATQCPTPEVQVCALACLVKIMQLYHDKMRFCMERVLCYMFPCFLKQGLQCKSCSKFE